MTTVLVSDDRRGVREALIRAMSSVPGVVRIEGVPHEFLVPAYSRQPADLVLIGAQRTAPTGVEATYQLVSVHPSAQVIMFGTARDAAIVAKGIAAGARGFLRWEAGRAELDGGALLAGGLPGLVRATPAEGGAELSERELQVLRGMSQGKSNSQIGRELFLSEDTIKTHARRMFRKLGVNDRAEAVAHGFRRGLVS